MAKSFFAMLENERLATLDQLDPFHASTTNSRMP
jgi:hypothetical protein